MKKIFVDTIAVLNRKERRDFFLLVILSLLISIVDILSLAVLLLVIAFYTQSAVPKILNDLPAWIIDNHSIALIVIFFLLFSAKSYAGYLIQKFQSRFVYNVAARISKLNLLRYFEGTYLNYVNIDSSVHIRKISQQPVEFAHYILSGIQIIITESILISLAIIAVLIYNLKLFFLLLVVLLPAVVLIGWFIRKRIKTVRINIKETGEKALQYLQEALSGYIESNIYARNDFFLNRYAVRQTNLNNYLSQLQITSGLPSRLIEVFAVFGLLMLIIFSSLAGSTFELVTIGAFIAAAYKIIPGLVKILNASGQLKAYEFTLEGLARLPQKKPDKLQDHPGLKSVSLRNLTFTYNHSPILNEVSFNISSGKLLGISGISGKGKTTLMNLLLGFIKPDKGVIYFNDKQVNEHERQAFWKAIAYVKQQPFLIYDTILKNITLNEDADWEKLNAIILATGLNKIINSLSEGLNHVITENGKNLSGGQQQRISLARALYKNADMIILDEPFNELDSSSVNQLMEHFKFLAESGKLILLVTHDNDTLSLCDQVISLDEQ